MRPLTQAQISQRLQAALKPGLIIFPDGEIHNDSPAGLTAAAVLIPFICKPDGWELLFTRRTDEVESHKGQVSFPGGACDRQDTDPQATALREAHEEIGLLAQDVRILGCMNDVATISNFCITPVVAVIPWPYPFQLSLREVSRVFSIPLTWLAQTANWEVSNFTPAGAPRSMPVIKYKPYDSEILWGISAQITVDLLKVLAA